MNTVTLINNVFQHNVANHAGNYGEGGGVLGRSSEQGMSTIIFRDNLVQANIASIAANGLGGGMFLYGYNSQITVTMLA